MVVCGLFRRRCKHIKNGAINHTNLWQTDGWWFFILANRYSCCCCLYIRKLQCVNNERLFRRESTKRINRRIDQKIQCDGVIYWFFIRSVKSRINGKKCNWNCKGIKPAADSKGASFLDKIPGNRIESFNRCDWLTSAAGELSDSRIINQKCQWAACQPHHCSRFICGSGIMMWNAAIIHEYIIECQFYLQLPMTNSGEKCLGQRRLGASILVEANGMD